MSEQPEDFSPLEHPSQISEARRRRRHYGFIPTTKGDRAVFMAQLAERLVANADYYLFSFLCGLVLAAAILLDNPAIYILAALLAPFMAPVVGLGFAAVVGSFRFFLQSLGSLLIGCGLVFAAGAIGGWISKLIPNLVLTQAHYHVNFTLPDFILLTIGILLAIYLMVKVPKNRSLVASVALAYEIYIPIGLAGFGLTSGYNGLIPQGLEVVGLWLAWVILIGTVFLAFLKIRPATFFGYLLTAVILAAALYTLLTNSAFGKALQNQMRKTEATSSLAASNPTTTIAGASEPAQTPTFTPAPGTTPTSQTLSDATPTNTIAPTFTPTETITPAPTAYYAKVYSTTSTGVWMRSAPSFSATGTMLSVGTLVEIVDPNPTLAEGIMWIQIRVKDAGPQYDKMGWIAQSLLETATPSPNW